MSFGCIHSATSTDLPATTHITSDTADSRQDPRTSSVSFNDGPLLMPEPARKLSGASAHTHNAPHDPHRVPPQALRDMFKELRSIKGKNDPRIAAQGIMDFGVSQADESADRAFCLDKAVESFLSQTHLTSPAILGNQLSPATYYHAAGSMAGGSPFLSFKSFKPFEFTKLESLCLFVQFDFLLVVESYRDPQVRISRERSDAVLHRCRHLSRTSISTRSTSSLGQATASRPFKSRISDQPPSSLRYRLST